jgi:hypothetical protein
MKDLSNKQVLSIHVELERDPSDQDIEAIYNLMYNGKDLRSPVKEVQRHLKEFFDIVVPSKPYRRSTEDQEAGVLVEVARYDDPREEFYVYVVIEYQEPYTEE